MRRLLKQRPSPAMIVALIALFVALGGSAVSASLIAGSRLANRSVSGAKIKQNSLGGNEINESRLGKVRRARRADSARSADSAKTLTGHKHFSYRAPANTPGRTIVDTGKLRISAACSAGGDLTLSANTTSNHAVIQSYGNGTDNIRDSDFLTTETKDAFSPAAEHAEARTIFYTEPGGQTVELRYVAADHLSAFNESAGSVCGFFGAFDVSVFG
jgi:hypothetical protein